MGAPSQDILCPACGETTVLKRTPTYEGFKKTGERLSCVSCGHVFADEASVPFKKKPALAGFTPKDLPTQAKIFSEGEAGHLCRHCGHYVVHPFVQRCALHGKLVEATDTCPRFKLKEK